MPALAENSVVLSRETPLDFAARVPGARLLDISEFQKADGGLTCLSLRL